MPAITPRCRVLVMGLGGAGCNSVARMMRMWGEGPNVVAVHTDTKVLASSPLPKCIQIGVNVTQGLGASGDTTVGKLAAEENIETIQELLANVDLLFLVVGLGGGTGTGAVPVIVQTAKQLGVLTLCFATMPFPFEGDRKRRLAEEGLRTLQRAADAVVCLPNERLLEMVDPSLTLEAAFETSDAVVGSGIHGLWRVLTQTGVMNLDFADVRQIAERSGGSCAFAYSEGSGPARVAMALKGLIDSPLLDKGCLLSHASGILVNITGGPDLTLADVHGIMGRISSMMRPGAHVFMGAIVDSTAREKVGLTVLASENWLEERAIGKGNTTTYGGENELTTVAATPAGADKPNIRTKADETQAELGFEPVDRGRFTNIEPTLYQGEDLDIPTFIRRGVRLMFDK
ncbi:MAG: cell division protein FtsZ [bacterium]